MDDADEEQDFDQSYADPLPEHESNYIKKQRLSIYQTRRVLAPYVKARQRPTIHTEENKYFSQYTGKKPSILMSDMTKLLCDGVDLLAVMNETAIVLKETTNSIAVTVYMVDAALDEIYQITSGYSHKNTRISYKITKNTNVAAYVAITKECLKIDDLIEDIRFPDGLGFFNVKVKAVICVPIVNLEDECVAIFELHRNIDLPAYDDNDLWIVIIMCGWVGATIQQNQQRITLQKQQELNEYLIDLSKCYFDDAVIFDKLISELVNFAKIALNAEHGLFLVLKPRNYEMYADLYKEGIGKDKDTFYKKNIEIKLSPTDTDLVSLVAHTGITINIQNAYDDDRVAQDKSRGYIITSVLCMPVKGYNEILGVIEVLNKRNGAFTKSDEVLCQTFATYCSFILTFAQLHEEIMQTNNLNNVYAEMLSLHMQPCIHDYYFVFNHPEVPSIPVGFHNFDFYITDTYELYMPHLLIYMFNSISPNMFENVSLMTKFILIVQKSYHDHPYHNFHHAFHVCHCIFNMLTKNFDSFTPFELKAFMVAAYCHDVDHYGVTNNFLEITSHHLAQLYEESELENHHYHVTVIILKFLKLFQKMSKQEYKEFLEEIKTLILATNLAKYFKDKIRVNELFEKGEFRLHIREHRVLFKGLMMTMADLSGLCKPFNVARHITDNVYKEFYKEGDNEKQMGLCPLPIMDREKQYMRPHDQINFITIIALPCAFIIAKVLPNCSVLYRQVVEIRKAWIEVQNYQGQKLWENFSPLKKYH